MLSLIWVSAEAVPVTDTSDGLIPFTRWITPFFSNKRYSAQMYLYLLPLDCPPALFDAEHDGGLEHTAAQWDTVSSWLERSHRGDIIVYEPQIFLLTMLSQYLTGSGNYAAEREALLKFIDHIPTGRTPHPTAQISWRDKVIGPYHLPVQLSGGRVALALEDPGPELEGSGRGGDYDRVVVVNTADEGPRQSKVVSRAEVEAEGRAAKL